MSKRALTRNVLLFTGTGFGVAVGLLWCNELFDLPHKLLAAPATPINWRESLLESAAILAVAAGVMSWTHRALARIRYLEGFLQMCMFCRKIHVDGKWVPFEEYITQRSEAVFSHGLCEDCMVKQYPEFAKQEDLPTSGEGGLPRT